MEQFTEWLIYAGMEPFGGPAEDLRAGTVASAVLAPHMPKGRQSPSPASWFRSTGRIRTREEEQRRRAEREEREWLAWARSAAAQAGPSGKEG